jgi:hypothetical protein
MDPITAAVNIIIGVIFSVASTLIQQALSPKQAKQASGYRARCRPAARCR